MISNSRFLKWQKQLYVDMACRKLIYISIISGEINEAEKCLKSLVDNGMVDNLSGKIESTHLDDNPPARDGSTTSKGKRSQKDAALESGSNVVPRQMDRQMSSITTPDCSANLSDIVNSRLNDFWDLNKKGKSLNSVILTK